MNIQQIPNYFASNLNLIREFNRWSMAEFAEETSVPKSTLQDVLKDGRTTLDTARCISLGLGIPLDILTNTALSPQEVKVTHSVLHLLDWYDHLTSNDQQKASQCLQTLFSLIHRGGENETSI